MINNEDKNELNRLFEEKVSSFESKEKEILVKKKEISNKYAKAYLKLVMDVIENSNHLYKLSNINVKNSTIGEYNDSGFSLPPRYYMTKNSLEILLIFSNGISHNTTDDANFYDEIMVNEILADFGINVQTISNTITIKFVKLPLQKETTNEKQRPITRKKSI